MPDCDPSLLSAENLDRSSPDLWPERVPGVSGYTHLHFPELAKSRSSILDEKPTSKEDLDRMKYYSGLNNFDFVVQLKKLYDRSYALGIDESKEMTRGKYLNIFEQNK